MVIFVIYISLSAALSPLPKEREEARRLNDLKGQKFLSGRATSMSFCPLPLLYPSASEFQFRYAPVTVGSGRVGLTCETCIYKISYQILFGFTVEYLLVR